MREYEFVCERAGVNEGDVCERKTVGRVRR
jgi:hypothetical protein